MKLTTLLVICLLCTLGNVVIDALTNNNNNNIITTEAAASLQIAKWEKQYHEYIRATIKRRKSGCTADNIVYRQEW